MNVPPNFHEFAYDEWQRRHQPSAVQTDRFARKHREGLGQQPGSHLIRLGYRILVSIRLQPSFRIGYRQNRS
jgi:hypothetical protein